jgi:hypothetical protein
MGWRAAGPPVECSSVLGCRLFCRRRGRPGLLMAFGRRGYWRLATRSVGPFTRWRDPGAGFVGAPYFIKTSVAWSADGRLEQAAS